ncbi:hypothetical protein, partial [Escherichia coli]|uniref:hypothetical protein n=1 Tax=Escherichia coli TaxID=562 RepID=UPI0023AF7227
RIAFEGGGGQDFGLAAAIATLIFLLVGALAIVNLKATRMKFDMTGSTQFVAGATTRHQ